MTSETSRRAALTLAIVVTIALAFAAPSAAGPGQASQARITLTFADQCRDFTAHSSKDISHVEIHFADGRVVKDETTTTPDYAIDGGPSDEIEFASVKSGTTTEIFTCSPTNRPPTAFLEVKTPENCYVFDDGQLNCDGTVPRTSWLRSYVPSAGYGLIGFGCGWPDDQSCVDHVMPCGQRDFYSLCEITYTYRGTTSTDGDDDIVSWSLDFGDGTVTSGDWNTNPPTAVSHTYQRWACPTCEIRPATLTVTDSGGKTASDAQLVFHQYPD